MKNDESIRELETKRDGQALKVSAGHTIAPPALLKNQSSFPLHSLIASPYSALKSCVMRVRSASVLLSWILIAFCEICCNLAGSNMNCVGKYESARYSNGASIPRMTDILNNIFSFNGCLFWRAKKRLCGFANIRQRTRNEMREPSYSDIFFTVLVFRKQWQLQF